MDLKPILHFSAYLSSVLTYSTNNYGIVFDHNMITNTFETDASELGDLCQHSIILYLFLPLGLFHHTLYGKSNLSNLQFNNLNSGKELKYVVGSELLFLSLLYCLFLSITHLLPEKIEI